MIHFYYNSENLSVNKKSFFVLTIFELKDRIDTYLKILTENK